jgi:hypothetical protein
VASAILAGFVATTRTAKILTTIARRVPQLLQAVLLPTPAVILALFGKEEIIDGFGTLSPGLTLIEGGELLLDERVDFLQTLELILRDVREYSLPELIIQEPLRRPRLGAFLGFRELKENAPLLVSNKSRIVVEELDGALYL